MTNVFISIDGLCDLEEKTVDGFCIPPNYFSKSGKSRAIFFCHLCSFVVRLHKLKKIFFYLFVLGLVVRSLFFCVCIYVQGRYISASLLDVDTT